MTVVEYSRIQGILMEKPSENHKKIDFNGLNLGV